MSGKPTIPCVPTQFREWMKLLHGVRGHQPLWPVLLGAALDAEFRLQKEVNSSYKGNVFIDRDKHPLGDGDREERLVARLFRSAHEADGCITLEGERIWLLGFQWPTQGSLAEKGRRADLIGMKMDGGLVVLEAKAATGDAPLIAILEGLDYLACLLRQQNFSRIAAGFRSWRDKLDRVVPPGFEQVLPDRDVRPTLVLLAPENYYSGRHSRSVRSRDWPLIAEIGGAMIPSVQISFAASDFSSTVLAVKS